MYDYGFRDYSPVSARFTTIDPIRDGSNWFSYVVNDPVNYVDLFGLTASDSKISVESNVSNDSSTVTTVTQTEVSTTTTATTATQTAATATIANITQSGNAQTQFTSFAQAPSVSMPVTSAPPVNTAGVFTSSIGRSHTNGIGQDSGGNSAQVSSSTLSEKIHKFLDVAGCFGDIPDVINAVIYLFEGNYKEAGWSASSLIPFTEIASKGRKVALNVIPEIVEFSGKHGDEVLGVIEKGWKLGDPIDKLTKSGKVPSWSTVRARYWKNKAYNFADDFTDSDLARMRKGKAPIDLETGVPMELHHRNGRNISNPHNIDNLQEVWPWQHSAIDPSRHYTGSRPQGE